MEYTSNVLFKGALASYKIISLDGKIFRASLLHYEGKGEFPPRSITFYNEDGAYMGDSDSINLISDLSDNIPPSNPLDEVLNAIKKKRKD